jgi:hypothetical protein
MLRPKVALALFAQILAALVLMTTPAAANDEPEPACNKKYVDAVWCSTCTQTSPKPTFEQERWTCMHMEEFDIYYWEHTKSYSGSDPFCGDYEKKFCDNSQKN